MKRSILVCIIALGIFAYSNIYAEEGDVFFSAKIQRSPKFMILIDGYANYPDRQRVYIHLQHRGKRVTATRAKIKNFRFSAKLKRFSKPLFPAKWRLVVEVKDRGTQPKATNYLLLQIGSKKEIKVLHNKERKFLDSKISLLTKNYNNILQVARKGRQKNWDSWLKRTNDQLNAIYIDVAKRQGKWKVPIYPAATEIALQIPGKISHLAKEVKEKIGENKQRNVDLSRLKNEIEINLQKAKIEINLKKWADMETLKEDSKFLLHLYKSLLDDYQKFATRSQIEGYDEIWQMWALGWQSQLMHLEEIVGKYKRTSKQKVFTPDVHTNFIAAIGMIKWLWQVHIQKLNKKYKKSFTSDEELKPESKYKKGRPADYHMQIRKILDKLTGYTNKYQESIYDRVEKDYDFLSEMFATLQKSYRKSKGNSAKKWDKLLSQMLSQNRAFRSKAMEYTHRKYKQAYPQAAHLFPVIASDIELLADEYDKELKAKPQVIKGGHGNFHQYDRKKKIKFLIKTIKERLAKIKKMLDS